MALNAFIIVIINNMLNFVSTNQPMMTCHILQTGLGVVVGRVVSAIGGHIGIAADHPPIARTRKDDER